MARLPRRKVLKAAAAAGAASMLSRGPVCQETADQEAANAPAWKKRVIEYLQRHARKDGGYGWAGQERSHLTPTFAVMGCYKLLGEEPPNKKALAQYVCTHDLREHDPPAGKYSASATVRNIATGEEIWRPI